MPGIFGIKFFKASHFCGQNSQKSPFTKNKICSKHHDIVYICIWRIIVFTLTSASKILKTPPFLGKFFKDPPFLGKETLASQLLWSYYEILQPWALTCHSLGLPGYGFNHSGPIHNESKIACRPISVGVVKPGAFQVKVTPMSIWRSLSVSMSRVNLMVPLYLCQGSI